MSDIVSVIVPVYNVENYLPKCLDSILNQTYKNLEIILVNDGSTDNSGKICDEYAGKDGRIKVIHKTNAGISSARNIELDEATGVYISFIDSDDWIEEKFIETLYHYASKDTIVCCGFNRVDREKITIYRIENLINCDRLTFLNYLYYYDIKTLKKGGINPIAHSLWNKLFPTQIFSNIRFPNGQTSEDMFVIIKLFNKINNFTVIPVANYNYRLNSNSITATISKKNLADYLLATLEQEKDLYSYEELLKTAKLLTACSAILNFSYYCYSAYNLNIIEKTFLKKIVNERKSYIPYSLFKLKIKVFFFLNAEFILKTIYKLKKLRL